MIAKPMSLSMAQFKRKVVCLGVAASFAMFVVPMQVHAQTKPVNAAPTTPTATILSSNQSGTACAQQYDDREISKQENINNLQTASLVAAGIAVAADIVGIGLEAAAAATLIVTSAVVPGILAQGVAVVASGVQLGIDIANQVYSVELTTQDKLVKTLPSCDQKFIGTIEVTAGGSNITGDSIFNDNLGVVKDVNVGGNVTATNVAATRGVSAAGGDLNFGQGRRHGRTAWHHHGQWRDYRLGRRLCFG